MPHQTYDPAFQGEIDIPGPPSDPGPRSGRGRWPPMLNLGDEAERRLKSWLTHEIEQIRMEKRDLVLDDWEQWQEDYWAKPAQKVKNFPFQKAANIVVPLTAIAVEAIHARMMNTLFAVEPFWSIRPRSKSWIEAAKPVERWLQVEVEDRNSLDIFKFATESLLELTKLGTGIGKSGYTREIRKVNEDVPGPNGRETREKFVTVKNGATLDWVPVANFLVRAGVTDPQEAAIVGEEHDSTWVQLKRMAQAGQHDPDAVEEVKQWVGNRVLAGAHEDYKEKLSEFDKHQMIERHQLNWQELWCSFDVDGDGWDEEIVVDYHYDSGTILSVRYNWYDDLHRPYRVSNFISVEGRIWGIGVGKQNEQFQREATTIRRQRLDNATLANMRMVAVKKTSGYGPGEPIFPGKMWFLDDPQADIQPIQMSEIYQSSLVNEQSVIRDSEKRTAVNEVTLGLPTQGTPPTATGDVTRLEEGLKKFSLVIKNIRRWMGQLGQDVLMNYQQFGTRQRHFIVEEEDGRWVERVLTMPGEIVRHGAVVDLTVTDSEVNRQVEQQQWMSLFQVSTNYYDRVIQLANLMGDPQLLAQVALRAVQASDEMMKRLLETFNVTDSDRFLLTTQEGERGQTASGPPGTQPEGNGRPGGAGPVNRVGGLSRPPPGASPGRR